MKCAQSMTEAKTPWHRTAEEEVCVCACLCVCLSVSLSVFVLQDRLAQMAAEEEGGKNLKKI